MKIMFLVTIILVLLLAGCTAESNVLTDIPNEDGEVAGFWSGLWHGLISPLAFLISLFNDKVAIYEVHNSGGWYNFGFLLGVSITFGGSGSGASRKRK